MQQMMLKLCKRITTRKYRRVVPVRAGVETDKSRFQSYQIAMLSFVAFIGLTVLMFVFYRLTLHFELLANLSRFTAYLFYLFEIASLAMLAVVYATYKRRERVSNLKLPVMGEKARKLSNDLRWLFNDKQIIDVLKFSNRSIYGDEMPMIWVYVADDLTSGYIAIENISNFEKLDREKVEQKVSGVLGGKYQRFAVVSSELTAGDTYVLFRFEDTQTSQRLYVEDDLKDFVSNDVHAIKLAKDLTWHSDVVPHLSIIARTRSGKSVLAGRYMARLMQLQGWTVDYNSAKFDGYVKMFRGKSETLDIVERAEYWLGVMDDRLKQINDADKDKYLEMNDMPDIALFFDEIGNLNADLELDKKLQKRWQTAINRLSATGASAGIHIIAISQYATTAGFLPSLARVNCSDAVIFLGGAADSAEERRFLVPGAELPERTYGKGQGIAKFVASGHKWDKLHYFEAPWFTD